jgi:hypothetical protein
MKHQCFPPTHLYLRRYVRTYLPAYLPTYLYFLLPFHVSFFIFYILLIYLLIYFTYFYTQNVYILHIVIVDFCSGFLSYITQVPTAIWQYQHTTAMLAVNYSGKHLLPRMIRWQDISRFRCIRIQIDCSAYLSEQGWKLVHFWQCCDSR